MAGKKEETTTLYWERDQHASSWGTKKGGGEKKSMAEGCERKEGKRSKFPGEEGAIDVRKRGDGRRYDQQGGGCSLIKKGTVSGCQIYEENVV